MTTTMITKSKCPNCEKEYQYNEVTSCIIYGNDMDIFLESLFDAYIKICDCGTEFNMSKNRIKSENMIFDFISSSIDKE